LGGDLIATGHYVRKREENGNTYLLKGLDNNKDQSYFLCAVNGEQISQSLFPVGELDKSEVRAIASKHDLITHDKKDSTGICFIGERRFKDFLQTYIPAQPGNIETPEGDILGQHSGLMYHTLGQRQGLGIGGVKGNAEAPWYVAKKDLEKNVLVVVQGNEHPLMYSSRLSTLNIDWINREPPTLPLKCKAKTRYRQPDQDCLLSLSESNNYIVEFDVPQRAVTPGQSIVFYQEDICLGGAVIEAYYQ
jgi:tRNA-uridine 2-sulfurtransferase